MTEHSQYKPAARMIISTAERFFFGALKDETKTIIYTVMAAMYWADWYLDGLPTLEKKQSTKDILDYLSGRKDLVIGNEPKMHKSLAILRKFLARSSPPQRAEFFDAANRIINSSTKIATTTSPQEFMIERKKEAIATADMLMSLAGELSNNKKYAAFLRHATVAGNYMDSLEDAKSDRQNQKVALKPVQIYFAAAQGLAIHAALTAWAHPRKKTVMRTGARLIYARLIVPAVRPIIKPSFIRRWSDKRQAPP